MTLSTFTGLEYLKIDIASHFGLDKLDWQDRINWVDEREDRLEQLLPQSEEPALYHAAVAAYRAAQRGEPVSHPISLDAASSGLQLLAVLSGCEDSARLCGVVSTGHREDAYMVITEAMGHGAKRADSKRAIMTSLYSSQAIPKEVFGEGEMLQIFYKTMETMAPGAWELNFGLQQLWQPYALSHDWIMPDNFHVHVPVESKVTQFVQVFNAPVAVELKVNQGTREGRSISPNIVHSIDGMIVREMHRRCTFDPNQMMRILKVLNCTEKVGTRTTEPDDVMVMRLWELYKASGFLSARILDHLCPENFGHVNQGMIYDLVFSMPEEPFPVISIHDCFRVHPNHGNDIRRQYNQLLSEIAASDMLAFIASQVTGQHVTVTKRGNIASKILEADYALC